MRPINTNNSFVMDSLIRESIEIPPSHVKSTLAKNSKMKVEDYNQVNVRDTEKTNSANQVSGR